jgi:hypothetical protein
MVFKETASNAPAVAEIVATLAKAMLTPIHFGNLEGFRWVPDALLAGLAFLALIRLDDDEREDLGIDTDDLECALRMPERKMRGGGTS